MPAQTKYLSSTGTQISKFFAAFFGGYFATMMIHLAVSTLFKDDTPVLLTSTYTSFFCWVGLMLLVYYIKKAWVAWTVILGIITIFSIIFYI
ncbi:hypothetical protein [Flammeovirga agarivorans]|uniref:DUF3649 domain-containing protein n=1 Tax=Flammeovirga agarivorans TaxID=2726742 RepID=A0A7X8SL78_9BACT|nr:hypothetical protein [Flammeovirga agarivorans]NLR92286.1 hypothetical protein [Flammeovirga agarivorans]